MTTQIYRDGQWINGNPSINYEQYREVIGEYPSNGYEYRVYIEQHGFTEYSTNNEQVTVNGNPTQGSEPVYFGMVGDSFTATCDIVDSEGVLQTQLDQVAQGYPAILALPVVKVIAGDIAKAVDEVYMNTTLVNGVLTAIGKFPTAGNWVLAKERINMALGEIGADWRVNIQDFSFRIVEKQS